MTFIHTEALARWPTKDNELSNRFNGFPAPKTVKTVEE